MSWVIASESATRRFKARSKGTKQTKCIARCENAPGAPTCTGISIERSAGGTASGGGYPDGPELPGRTTRHAPKAPKETEDPAGLHRRLAKTDARLASDDYHVVQRGQRAHKRKGRAEADQQGPEDPARP